MAYLQDKTVMRHYFVYSVAFLIVLPWVTGCVLTNPTPTVPPSLQQDVVRHPPGIQVNQAKTATIAGPLSLSRAIKLALANNPDVAMNEWDVRAAQARRDVAGGERWPSLHGAMGYNYFLYNQRLLPIKQNGEAGAFSRDIITGDIILTMPLFTGGRITNSIKASELLKRTAQQRLARTRKELVFNVTSVFYRILAQRHVIESLQFSQKSLEDHHKRVKELMASQKAAQVDLLRTEVRLANLQEQLVQEKNVLAIQRQVLANLLGIQVHPRPIEVRGDLSYPQDNIPTIDDSLARAFKQRSDYRSANLLVEAQARMVDTARAGHWPAVYLQGSYGGRWGMDISEQPRGSRTSDDNGRLGIVVDVPIFEGGRINARVREQRARLAAAREQLRKLRLQVHLDVETAVLNIESSQERVEATRAVIEEAKESLRIEREKYNQGKGSITSVLDAQSALLASQTNYYRALADNQTSRAQWHLAVGDIK